MTSTTVDALKALYVARGGSADTVANLTLIPDVINALATLETSGATKELPTVSAANDGQILTVVDGAWAAANAPVELPTVSGDNDGEVLTVVSGAWAAAALPESAETTNSEITG